MNVNDICHVEIRTRDIARAKKFYPQVFDWRLEDWMPGYTGIDTGVEPGGGIFQTPSPQIPTGVCNYVLVEDCEASGRRASELGGRVIVPKTEVPQAGWFVNTLDPWGNEIGLWQPADPTRRSEYKASGKNGFCWVELAAQNLDASVSYYGRLFGWRFQSDPKMAYAFTEHQGKPIGIGLLGGEGAKSRQGVLTYVDVDDLGAAAKRIEAAGGRVVFGPQEIPETGSFSVFADADGNRLAIFKSARPQK
jgi:hypothetical protein